jgi:hypothetical protein
VSLRRVDPLGLTLRGTTSGPAAPRAHAEQPS